MPFLAEWLSRKGRALILMTYSEKLKDPRWQKKRLEILSRDEFSCQSCGDTESSLQVHHKNYFKGREPWEYNENHLVTLCDSCHYEISSLIFDLKQHIGYCYFSVERIKLLESIIKTMNTSSVQSMERFIKFLNSNEFLDF